MSKAHSRVVNVIRTIFMRQDINSTKYLVRLSDKNYFGGQKLTVRQKAPQITEQFLTTHKVAAK
jgi:hypothetical protein